MEEARNRLEADWKDVLGTAQGRRVLGNLLKACGVFSAGQLGGPEVNAFQMGKRAVGDFMLSQITAARPELLGEIFREGMGQAS